VAPGTIVEPLGTGAASIIRSDFLSGGHRNFEVVALQNRKLVHYWKDNADVNWAWHKGQVVTAAAVLDAALHDGHDLRLRLEPGRRGLAGQAQG
jgi:hypothetical protein